jgi:glycosyltransferase involved in cell wall biosynthesis
LISKEKPLKYKYEILHITVHLGGGIGTVLLNWMKKGKNNHHVILCLNSTYYKDYYKDYDKTYNGNVIYENMRNKYTEINEWIKKADIVIVHFWNHPILFEFLVNTSFPPCRLCFWSHISGLNPPYIFFEKLVEFPDMFIFSSPISFEAKEIKELPPQLKEKLINIWTTGNLNEYFDITPIHHEGFNIGYLGTLDFTKLHPNFVDFCSKINIPDVRFIMIGVGRDSEKLKQQVKEKGLEDKFLFTGIIDDIKPYLSIIDVFGYPLNPKHFGTCEQVLGEAMAAGIIPIVMKNPAEEYILFQSLVKFVCSNENEYVHNIELLYRERSKKASIINLMQEHITQLYDSDKMVTSWENVFNNMITQEKIARVWKFENESIKKSGYKIFIESLGNYGKIFEDNNVDEIQKLYASNLQWHSLSKGSPKQYLESFPDDEVLKKWVELLN